MSKRVATESPLAKGQSPGRDDPSERATGSHELGRGNRRWRRQGVALILAAFTIVVVWAAIDLWRVRAELNAGGAMLESLSLADLEVEQAVEDRVADASRHVRAGDKIARTSPALSLLSSVPGLGRQVHALRDVSGRAATFAAIGSAAASDLGDALNQPAGATDRLLVLDDLARRLRATALEMDALDAGHHRWIAPPIASAERRLNAGVNRARTMLDQSAMSVSALQILLTGPSRLLVLATSNAEMRAGMGMPLHAGVLTTHDGAFDMEEFQATSDLILDAPVALPTEIDQLYGWLSPGREWRNTASSANFPALGPVFADLASGAGLGTVDGVIAMDVVGLSNMLDAVGEVSVLGVPLRAGNIERLLLNEIYLRPRVDRDTRHRALGTVARAVVMALSERDIPPRRLVAALGAAVGGRHLMVWSRDPVQQRTWQSVGVAGQLDPHGMLIGVQNHGGYKLDWYVRPEVTIAASRRGDWRSVTMRIDVRNTSPPGLPDAVAGSTVRHLATGSYRAFTTIYLPGAATNIRIDGDRILIAGRDGPMKVVAARFDVAPETTHEVRVSFDLPSSDPLYLLPSARAHPIEVHGGLATISDATRVRLW